jgi:hypothetical protein
LKGYCKVEPLFLWMQLEGQADVELSSYLSFSLEALAGTLML